MNRFFATFIRGRLPRGTGALLSFCLTFLLNSPLQAAICSVAIQDEWNTGFKAQITIANDGDVFNEWQLHWTWPAGTALNNYWNATINCHDTGCQATPPAWKPTISTGNEYQFGFVANKGDGAAPSFNIDGDVCSDNAEPAAAWTLSPSESNLSYVSLKKDQIAELNHFSRQNDGIIPLTGTIEADGSALLKVDLNSVETAVDIRNNRLLSFLFETETLPDAWFSTAIGPEIINGLPPGDTRLIQITGELSLHAITQQVTVDVLVTKLSAQTLSVSTVKPIIIDALSFDMLSGIESLKKIANLSQITRTVPVYFHLLFEANVNTAPALLLPQAPATPDELLVSFNQSELRNDLSWRDNSDVESHYLIRRRTADGNWKTSTDLGANARQASESLADTGNYEYKVIAVNNSIPSNASESVAIAVTEGNPIIRGQSIFQSDCAGCHGTEGEGIGGIPALNVETDIQQLVNTIVTTMPFGNAAACDQGCAEDVAAYIQTLWVSEVTCDVNANSIRYGARQLKILTRSEYQRTVEDLTGIDYPVAEGLSEDTLIGFFANNTHSAIVPAAYSNYLLVAEEIAAWLAERDFNPVLSCNSVEQNCANRLISDFAPKAFRRPLTTEEVSLYSAIVDGSQTGGDVKLGIQLALEGLLSSPQFLYRHELGEPNPGNNTLDNDAYELTSWEMATFLAYTFTGSTPDDELLAAAQRDELRTTEGINTQAQRLVSSGKAVLSDFVGSWLGTKDLALAAKDPALWPGFPNLVPLLTTELNETFAHIMLDKSHPFSALYNADFTFLNSTLAQHYGIDGVSSDTFTKVPTNDRGGILANGAFMARWGEARESSPILRSVRVRRRMLCQDQPDPPAGTFAAREAKLAELATLLSDPTTTNRLKYHRLTEDSPCTSCHTQYINPLGFGMEDFDTLGRVRTQDLNGNTIDSSGELYAPENYRDIDQFLPFIGAKGLGSVLATLPSAQQCLPQQFFRFVMGVGHNEIDGSTPAAPQLSEPEQAGYACEIESLTNTMTEGSPAAMFEAFGTLDAVRYRKAWSRE